MFKPGQVVRVTEVDTGESWEMVFVEDTDIYLVLKDEDGDEYGYEKSIGYCAARPHWYELNNGQTPLLIAAA